MLETKNIAQALAPVLESRGLFLVDVSVSKDNDVTVTVESKASCVTLDDCEALNRFFTQTFDQDTEDYSLTVTSAGLDGAFKVDAQYEKAVGSKVEIWLKGGKKQVAVLQGFDAQTLSTGSGVFERSQINKVKYYIEF